jgi:lipid II:glycine glycyltransferase (peptidoglycan interpeptide bridge formation enzyme)
MRRPPPQQSGIGNGLPSADDGPPVTTFSSAPGPALLKEWDEFVRSVPGADVAQLSGWARLREQAGYRADYVFVHQGGRLAGGAQALVRRVAGVDVGAYISNGPLVSPTAEGPAVRDAVADGVALVGHRCRMLFVQPLGNDMSEALLERRFRASDAGIAPSASLRVDLTVDETELRRKLSKRLRTWTNAWEDRGVTVRLGVEEDLPLLARLLAETGRHQGFVPFSVDYLTTMYRELSPGGHLVCFVGETAGRAVAMTLLTACGGTLKVRLLGFDRAEETSRLNVPAAIYWTAMKWGKAQGFRWLDFGGVLDESLPVLLAEGPVDVEALAGQDKYKLRFGGEVVRFPPPVEMIRSPVVRAAYDLARRTTAGRAVVARAKTFARAGRAAGPGGSRGA